jgi:hypothetical protein
MRMTFIVGAVIGAVLSVVSVCGAARQAAQRIITGGE